MAKFSFLTFGHKDAVTGGNRYNTHLFAALSAEGHQVTYIDSLEFFRAKNPDSVLVIDSICIALIVEAEHVFPPRLIVLYHMPPEKMNSELTQCPTRRNRLNALLQQAEIVVTGQQSRLYLARHYPHVSRVTRIIAGINQGWRRKTEYKRRPRQLLFVASIQPCKGYKRLLSVLAKMGDAGWHLRIYGEDILVPAYAEEVKAEFAATPLNGSVAWCGAVSQQDLNAAMCRADLLLVCSDFESFSMVTQEAIASGLPVLSTPVGESTLFARNGGIRYAKNFEVDSFVKELDELCCGEHAYQSLVYALSGNAQKNRSWDDAAAEFMQVVARL